MSYSSSRAASVEQLIGALRRYIICAAQWIEQLLQLTQSEDTNEKVSFEDFSIENDCNSLTVRRQHASGVFSFFIFLH